MNNNYGLSERSIIRECRKKERALGPCHIERNMEPWHNIGSDNMSMFYEYIDLISHCDVYFHSTNDRIRHIYEWARKVQLQKERLKERARWLFHS